MAPIYGLQESPIQGCGCTACQAQHQDAKMIVFLAKQGELSYKSFSCSTLKVMEDELNMNEVIKNMDKNTILGPPFGRGPLVIGHYRSKFTN